MRNLAGVRPVFSHTVCFVWSHAYTTALRLVVIIRTTDHCCYERSCELRIYKESFLKNRYRTAHWHLKLCIKIIHKSESYNVNAIQGKISKRWRLYKGLCLRFEQYIYKKNEGFKPTSRRQNVAEISVIHRSTLQSVLLANLYFNYDQSLVGPTGFQLLNFCCTSVSELVCCWVLVLFHPSDESLFTCSLFWFIDE